ncbi:MAG TPA: HTTM domain-containing protein [Thermodesulfobacteriota bacterium]|nr:HTTM domain-containing protein [Thermodesulfobacteriota bacterium]
MNSITGPSFTGLNSSPKSSHRVKGKLLSFLFIPIDIASLVYFRIAFGGIMLWEVIRYFQYDRIKRYYLEPKFLFTYYGFDWVHPWPGDGLYYHFLALGVLSLFIMLGFFYRVSTFLFFLGFTYVFLLDQTHYLNHFYFVSLVSFLMIFIPAHRAFSIDAWRRQAIRSETAPAWALWILRAQMGIVYFYGGLAKLNFDWLHGEPMRIWLGSRAYYPYVGWLFSQEWTAYFFSYGGLLFDLLAVPLLLWRKTRIFAFCWAVAFHLSNVYLFRIGIFPWFSIAATALFFSPDWPRRFLAWCCRFLSIEIPYKLKPQHVISTAKSPLQPVQHLVIALLVIHFTFQILFPFRHHLYPGNVSWTEEGHNFSWMMKLRSKVAKTRFFATNPVTDETWEIKIRDYLTNRQRKKMTTRPDMILNFSHYLANELRKQGYEKLEIRAEVWASLNGRKLQLLVDPTVNLASQQRSLLPAKWIMPLLEPLPTREQRNNYIEKLTNHMNTLRRQKGQAK